MKSQDFFLNLHNAPTNDYRGKKKPTKKTAAATTLLHYRPSRVRVELWIHFAFSCLMVSLKY